MTKGKFMINHNRLIDKWEKTGLLEGLSLQNKEKISQLLENQAQQIFTQEEFDTQKRNDKGKYLFQEWKSVCFPIIRRVYSSLIDEFNNVRIEPMPLPACLIGERTMVAHTRNLSVRFDPPFRQDLHAFNQIEIIADYIQNISDLIIKNISDEIKADLEVPGENYIYAPYVPLYLMCVTHEENEEVWGSLATRYAKCRY